MNNKIIEIRSESLRRNGMNISDDIFTFLTDITHIGFDIENNIITDIKFYSKSKDSYVKKKFGIDTARFQNSISVSNMLTKYRWSCRPDFEPAPYEIHIEILKKLLKEIRMETMCGKFLEIADEMQKAAKSQRYPLIAYGAVHKSDIFSQIIGIKLYYTFWQADLWNAKYASNNSDISMETLQSILQISDGEFFCSTAIDIASEMIKYNNLLSMYAINLDDEKYSEKIYFVTDDNTWLDSVNMLHHMLYREKINPTFRRLFYEIRNIGFRFEEILYSVNGNIPKISVYFMI